MRFWSCLPECLGVYIYIIYTTYRIHIFIYIIYIFIYHTYISYHTYIPHIIIYMMLCIHP